MKKISLLLLAMLSACFLCGEKVVEMPELSKPDSIHVDKDNIYITEFPNIYIYSKSDFTLKKKFGRKGEGPGEFLKYTLLYIRPGHLLVSDRNKVSYFSKEGKYIKEIKAQSLANWGVMPLGDKFVGKSRRTENKISYDRAVLYSPDFKKEKEIYRYRFFYTLLKGRKRCNAVEVRGIQFHTFAEKVFIQGEEGFTIDVLDMDGNRLYTINRDYEKVKITGADKKRYRDYFQTTIPWKRLYDTYIKREMFFPEYFPAIQQFLVVDNKIYVLTYKKLAGKAEFIVLDLKGEFTKKLYLPFDNSAERFHYSLYENVVRRVLNAGFTIKDGKLYCLLDNPDSETWELHIHDFASSLL